MNLEAKIEGLLFYKSEPVKKVFLAEFFDVSPEVLEESLSSLATNLQNRGITLVTTDTTVQLTTAEELADSIEQIRTEELSKDIGKAGAETLAIILYRGPLSRSEVDKIRGVNSTFIIRNLMVRGLVEKRSNPKDSRSFLYAITPALLQHLGIRSREELPEFENIMNALEAFDAETQEPALETNPFTSQI